MDYNMTDQAEVTLQNIVSDGGPHVKVAQVRLEKNWICVVQTVIKIG